MERCDPLASRARKRGHGTGEQGKQSRGAVSPAWSMLREPRKTQLLGRGKCGPALQEAVPGTSLKGRTREEIDLQLPPPPTSQRLERAHRWFPTPAPSQATSSTPLAATEQQIGAGQPHCRSCAGWGQAGLGWKLCFAESSLLGVPGLCPHGLSRRRWRPHRPK